MEAQEKPLMNPYKTICVCKHGGKVVGRVLAVAPHAEEYITSLVRQYGDIQVDYEEDPTDGLLQALYQRYD